MIMYLTSKASSPMSIIFHIYEEPLLLFTPSGHFSNSKRVYKHVTCGHQVWYRTNHILLEWGVKGFYSQHFFSYNSSSQIFHLFHTQIWRHKTSYHGTLLITVSSDSVHSPFSDTGSSGGTLTTSPNHAPHTQYSLRSHSCLSPTLTGCLPCSGLLGLFCESQAMQPRLPRSLTYSNWPHTLVQMCRRSHCSHSYWSLTLPGQPRLSRLLEALLVVAVQST